MILITGGAGYIGSHLALQLMKENRNVLIYDNLVNSTLLNLKNAYKQFKRNSTMYFVKGDIRDSPKLEQLFKTYTITKVIHLAGLKSVSESGLNQHEYTVVNVYGSSVVMNLAMKYNVQTIIFSSTAAVYFPLPVGRYHEKMSVTGTSSHYSHTKLETENLLLSLKEKDVTTDIVILRYFNPVGLDSSGLMIEENIITSNLFPNIVHHLQNDSYLNVYGNDYSTYDGTAVRDYIHISDLIDVHMLIINDVVLSDEVRVFNVGSDTGYSVKEVIDEFNKQLNQPIKFIYKERRKGDVQMLLADTSKLQKMFNWKPKYELDEMVRDTLRVNTLN